jgi:hypothetical protein
MDPRARLDLSAGLLPSGHLQRVDKAAGVAAAHQGRMERFPDSCGVEEAA